MADIYKQKQWELDSAIDDLYTVANRYEVYRYEVNRFIDNILKSDVKEIDRLQQRIDKAIEYIEKSTKETDFDNDKLIDVLDILKGSDSNE